MSSDSLTPWESDSWIDGVSTLLVAATARGYRPLVFISVMAIILSPAVHRLLHKFHVDELD